MVTAQEAESQRRNQLLEFSQRQQGGDEEQNVDKTWNKHLRHEEMGSVIACEFSHEDIKTCDISFFLKFGLKFVWTQFVVSLCENFENFCDHTFKIRAHIAEVKSNLDAPYGSHEPKSMWIISVLLAQGNLENDQEF